MCYSWAMLQPDESTYDFTKLDRIMELVKKNGLKVVLATSTGAHIRHGWHTGTRKSCARSSTE